MVALRYDYAALLDFATELGVGVGLPRARGARQAEILVEGDLIGHTTHGLALLSGMLKGVQTGTVRAQGEPHEIADHGSTLVWDADRLPGTWMLTEAIAEARRRIPKHPVMTVVLRRMSHIAALGAYLRQATDHGLLIWIMNSDPAMRTVAPAGGIEPQFAPNPLAFGYPTDGDPVLIDISTSSVANGWVRRWSAEKKKLPGAWLQDRDGNVTDDPTVLFADPPGSMLPLGGLELGHKGFALGLIVEVLTCGLSGLGRADGVTGGGSPVFLQLIDPNAFAGGDALRREAGWLADRCRASRARAGETPVRMPGDKALAMRRAQLHSGVELYPAIMPELARWAETLAVKIPSPLQ